MNVHTIEIPKDEALTQLQQYRGLTVEKRRKEDVYFRKLFRMAAEYKLLDVAAALKETGVNEQNQPRLALAKAHWKVVWFDSWWNTFQPMRGHARYKRDIIKLPSNTYPTYGARNNVTIRSAVPFLPPNLRPEDDIENYHILFEVKEWEQYPADPFLLKHVHGWLYAVIGEWELTELERSLLTALQPA